MYMCITQQLSSSFTLFPQAVSQLAYIVIAIPQMDIHDHVRIVIWVYEIK